MQALRSDETSNLSFVISATREADIQKLNAMGAAKVASIDKRALSAVVNDLKIQKDKDGIAVGLIAAEDRVHEFDTGDIIVYGLQAPEAQPEGTVYAIPWALILTDFLDKIYNNKKVTSAASEVRKSSPDIIKSNDLAKLNNLLSTVFDVPMVAVTDKEMQKQITAYKETIDKL
jgi:hypothetical protein